MYHNTYVAEHVAARDRIERERAAEQAALAELLREQPTEPIGSTKRPRSLWALRPRNNLLLAVQTMLSAVASRSSRSH